MYNRRKTKGFTLIELMVVIAIITLLSSVILASVKEVRDRANQTKFKAEMNQFINALELYRTKEGKYPFEGATSPLSQSTINNNNSMTQSGTNDLVGVMSNYIKQIPQVPANSFLPTGTAWTYRINTTSVVPIASRWRCAGDTTIPKYVILFYIDNDDLYNKIYQSLPGLERSGSHAAGYPEGTWFPLTFSGNPARCYSPK